MASEFKGLIAWQKAVDLVEAIYQTSSRFPRVETFGLTQQIRRAAISVPSNIAEGRGRSSAREYRVFLLHARGSVYEIETQLEVAKRLGYVGESDVGPLVELANEVARLINGVVRSLDRKG